MHDPLHDRQRGEAFLDQRAAQLKKRLRLVTPEDPYEPDDDITPEDCGIDSDQDWKAGLLVKVNQKTGETTVLCRVHNRMLILEHDPSWRERLGFNAFSQQITCAEQEWTAAQVTELKAWLEKVWISGEVKTSAIHEAVEAVAWRHPYHPVRDYLTGLHWDGEDRLSTFFTDYCGTPFTPYSMAVARSLFISAVARIMNPGSKVDTMIVLEGSQGVGKLQLVLTSRPAITWKLPKRRVAWISASPCAGAGAASSAKWPRSTKPRRTASSRCSA